MATQPPKKILVIDDDMDALDTLQTILEKNGYIVVTAMNGKTGIQKAWEEKPNMIILDVMMPDMDGYQVCEIIKTDAVTKNIPIIMLTGRDMGEDVALALDKKADWFITKPYDIKYLMSKVTSFLDGYKF
jgi:two-component system alkaline phosphatase synthesis response regulator PhoP